MGPRPDIEREANGEGEVDEVLIDTEGESPAEADLGETPDIEAALDADLAGADGEASE
jgi:hypothetical protein